jgi:hypothetical protein
MCFHGIPREDKATKVPFAKRHSAAKEGPTMNFRHMTGYRRLLQLLSTYLTASIGILFVAGIAFKMGVQKSCAISFATA